MCSLRLLKTVIQTRDFERSRDFYTSVLGLPLVDEWDQEEGRGAIVGLGDDASAGQIEISAVPEQSQRHDESFDRDVVNDKIVIQVETDSVDLWVARLTGRWPMEGPIDRPWGQRYLRLRDPDGVMVALYEVVV
jgi:catechol 2,3-dioxygenase-like lactoylglutathione lyase family enzyme